MEYGPNFSCNERNWWKNLNSLKKILKKHFWTRRMQNRGARVKTSEKTPKTFGWRSEKDEEIAVLRKKTIFLQNVPLDTLIGVLTTPTKTCRHEAKNFSSMSETEQENYITNEFIPHQIVLLGYIECSFHNLVEIILTRSEIFSPNKRIHTKINFVSKNIRIQNVPMVM